MKRCLSGAIVGALAAGAILGAAPAQADIPNNPSPWDYTGDVIKLPFLGSIKFIGADEWGQNYRGVKGPRGADRSGPRQHGNPSG
ncbi:hypothetical protein [Mycolicibacterium diernhoferi]|uniref:Porin n=1 Tax=Mycolicibacterium diernhoferi TaxID=1801 RepID=A0A1Q4H485_9MYCO|nr:hypothetical protein [Mycolicibacterium diernhoferi]OJZ61987.1 hypothetical protein BRW64_27405 [Mycolicibacterium diernhoferi]OPE54325.1 hypothetical protein BV510_10940 [Mycolicibacterium diernhoferi]PEG51738.1 hypothetical protein CRI78_25195 [Mycolicibacterium diernhoferi]QYL23476.1 hypothetical protein K0O62_03850 [Mycolicibacterium diernhoferi]